jgi:DNA-binding transcriptional LysR family regulator
MPADFANQEMSQFLSALIAAHPAIAFEIDLSPRRVDLIGENFDVAIRTGDLPDDASLAARRLAVFTVGLYASPAYIARHGLPSEPEALMEHDALLLLARNGEATPWKLSRNEEKWEGIPPGRASANSPELLTRLARNGDGIIMLPDNFAECYVKSGELIRILGDWQSPDIKLWAVFPGRRLMPARTRVFLDALQQQFESTCASKQSA